MKKFLGSWLVIILTVITVFVMATYGRDSKEQVPVFTGNENSSDNTSDGTGYIFDDYDQNINIPINDKTKKKDSDIRVPDGRVRIARYRIMHELLLAEREEELGSPGGVLPVTPAAGYEAISRSANKNMIEKVEDRLTLEDKLSLLKIAAKMNLKDISAIRKAIDNGVTNEESRGIWNMLKGKLSPGDYDSLIKIIDKYEQ